MSIIGILGFIILVSFVGLSLSAEPKFKYPPGITECHPTPDPTKTHYIVGYGSLISEESKGRTYPDTGINIPVTIGGFKRTWTARGTSNVTLSTTYLGVDMEPTATLNGVIFSVPSYEAVEKYDKREMLYCRVPVPYEKVTVNRGTISDNGTFPTEEDLKNSNFWVYVTSPDHRYFPDDRYPIVQSYVDIFLGGCINMEKKYGLENFAKKCVTTTQGWDNPWVNDRLHPRRPWTYQKDAWFIDQLINKYIPGYNTYLEKIYVGRSINGADSRISSNINSVTAAIVAPTLALACVR